MLRIIVISYLKRYKSVEFINVIFTNHSARAGYDTRITRKQKWEENNCIESPSDKRMTSHSRKKGNLKRETESFLTAEQNNTIYQPPPLGQDMTHGQFFKRCLTGFNSEFSFF